MIKISFNKKNILPDIKEYLQIFISVLIVVYGLQKLLLAIFPVLNNLSEFWFLVVWIFIVIYFRGLFDIKLGKVDYF